MSEIKKSDDPKIINKVKQIDGVKQELIKAKLVAERIGDVTKFQIGRLHKQGYLSRTKDMLYPWPQAQAEYDFAKQDKQNYSQRVTASDNVAVSQDEATNVINTEKLIKLLEDGSTGSETKAYQWARALKEVISAKTMQLKLREMEGKTLNVADVEKWVFNTSRQNKDLWMNWPQMVATEMAEELGVDSAAMHSILLKHVRKNLERIATLPDGYESAFDGKSPKRTTTTT